MASPSTCTRSFIRVYRCTVNNAALEIRHVKTRNRTECVWTAVAACTPPTSTTGASECLTHRSNLGLNASISAPVHRKFLHFFEIFHEFSHRWSLGHFFLTKIRIFQVLKMLFLLANYVCFCTITFCSKYTLLLITCFWPIDFMVRVDESGLCVAECPDDYHELDGRCVYCAPNCPSSIHKINAILLDFEF